MTDRSEILTIFCAEAGWGDVQRTALAGDASSRRYVRLRRPNGTTAILMDADPATGQDIRPFVAIAQHLAGLGLSSPEILAADPDQGLMLLEDFGDDLVSRVAARDPAQEPMLYRTATDILLELHRHPPPEIAPRFSAQAFGSFTDLAVTWYARALTGATHDPAPLCQAVTRALGHIPPCPSILALRDYHAENLVWRPHHHGTARLGLLDFQDAMAAHPIYDVVSLIEDARRDVSPQIAAQVMAQYSAESGLDRATLDLARHIWGVQRNSRILGVFARLAIDRGKPGYIHLIPRTWSHLMADLTHPDLADLRKTALSLLPEPTPSRLAALTAKIDND